MKMVSFYSTLILLFLPILCEGAPATDDQRDKLSIYIGHRFHGDNKDYIGCDFKTKKQVQKMTLFLGSERITASYVDGTFKLDNPRHIILEYLPGVNATEGVLTFTIPLLACRDKDEMFMCQASGESWILNSTEAGGQYTSSMTIQRTGGDFFVNQKVNFSCMAKVIHHKTQLTVEWYRNDKKFTEADTETMPHTEHCYNKVSSNVSLTLNEDDTPNLRLLCRVLSKGIKITQHEDTYHVKEMSTTPATDVSDVGSGCDLKGSSILVLLVLSFIAGMVHVQ